MVAAWAAHPNLVSIFLVIADTERFTGSMHRAAETASFEPTQVRLDVNTIARAVALTTSLLELQPLSHKASLKASTGQPAQSEAQPVTDVSAVECIAADAPAGAQVSDLPEKWPRPTPDEWQDVDLVAARAFTTLHWSSLPQVMRSVSAEDYHMLVASLAYLLHCLVVGHLLDVDLDVSMLFSVGLDPVLRLISAGHAEYTDLAVAMLSRLAMDRALIPTGCRQAQAIFAIFCESLCKSMCFARCLRCSSDQSRVVLACATAATCCRQQAAHVAESVSKPHGHHHSCCKQ